MDVQNLLNLMEKLLKNVDMNKKLIIKISINNFKYGKFLHYTEKKIFFF